MNTVRKSVYRKRRGSALIISMIFVLIFSALAVAMASLSGNNVQIAENHRKTNTAFSAAQSGLDCGKYIVTDTLAYLPSTGSNFVTDAQADATWDILCERMQALQIGGQMVAGPVPFTDTGGSGYEIVTPSISFGAGTDFTVRFYRYDGDPHTIMLQATGVASDLTRRIKVDMEIRKDAEVMTYTIASRGRVWLTGESTIHGDVFSLWDRADISPFNMTSDSRINGTINTVLTLDEIETEGAFQMETLDDNGNPIDANGNPLGTNYEDRFYGPDDEVQAYHENINYGQPYENMPGMDISDYDTDEYNSSLTNIAGSDTIEVEYFPHAPSDQGGYSMPRNGTPGSTWNRELDRHVYENQTFTDVRLPDNRNALFRNCTFEGTLYIDCYKSGRSKYNNVRFEDCTFNGTIVTDVPQRFKWKHNVLYFTGAATFDNQTDVPATILAPHFNVNLGNTNPDQGDNNILTGAIIGGIVDVRGNAQVYGTIISMYDTTGWSSGYVTNIGATLDDGGSETTEPGDVGVIDITPPEDKMLPSGITSPIVIVPDQSTYSEGT